MSDFEVSMEDANEINEIFKRDPRSHNRNICICGHAVSRHSFDKWQNKTFCKPGQLSCPCVQPRAVLDVPNTRYFMRKSQGNGAKHALVRGVAASIEVLGQEEFEEKRTWLVEPKCDICKEPAKYNPVSVDSTGVPVEDYREDDVGLYVFMCELCRSVH